MGLTAWLARHAAARPPAFVVTAPGGTAARLAAEAELRRHGHPPASTPAQASVLVVCGDPGHDLQRAIDLVWSDMPNPRALARVPTPAPAEVAAARQAAVRSLADLPAQHTEAATRKAAPWHPAHAAPAAPEAPDPRGGHDPGEHDAHDAGGHDAGGRESHAGHDAHDMHGGHGAHDAAGHDGHGAGGHGAGGHDAHDMQGGHGAQGAGGHDLHGGHEHHMGVVQGLEMAGRGADRDGLRLDVLHVPLGPVLSCWPAGLVVRTELQGDVVQDAEVSVVGGVGGERYWDEPWLAARSGVAVSRGRAERRRAAAHLDSLGRLLAVAGWPDVAVRVVRLRDDLLGGARPAPVIGAEFERLARRILRSRLLRWMLREVGVVDQAAARRYELSGPAGRYPGDVAARLAGWIDNVRASLAGVDDPTPVRGADGPRGPVGERPSAALLEVLPALLRGADLAAARLIVASLDPDVDQLAAEHVDA